ncbi:MAG: heavy metal transport/detoxification protein [Chitinophagaceae bacterium]|jgi:hypothetical protein|nr:heavy metal transport/detoxification protein [Chitinophagaceae bacterium]
MELIKYRTNIRSEKSVCKIAPYLNQAVGAPNWQIDISSSDRTLEVFSHGRVDERSVIKAIKKAGFSAENIDDYYALY